MLGSAMLSYLSGGIVRGLTLDFQIVASVSAKLTVGVIRFLLHCVEMKWRQMWGGLGSDVSSVQSRRSKHAFMKIVRYFLYSNSNLLILLYSKFAFSVHLF